MINLNIDWNPIIVVILQAVLPVLVGAIASYFVILARSEWVKLQANQPDLVDKIQLAANWAFGVVEQLKKNNQLPISTEAKEYAEMLVDKYLKAKGVNIDLSVYEQIISAAIEFAINENRNIVATTSITTVKSSSSKVVSPVKTSAKVAKDGITGISIVETPSVVTTTTSTVSSDNSNGIVPVIPIVNDGKVSIDGSVG